MLRFSLRIIPRLRIRDTQRLSNSRAFHKNFNPDRENQVFRLADGRNMGFAQYGDLSGVPAFCFHGSPGSRYDGYGFSELAEKLKVHIISPDRPGHGLSSFHPNRKLGDYPHDISQLAKHLNLPQYHVFGASGGGPYAVACAYGSPKHELLNVGVLAGMGPPEVVTIKQAGLYTVAALQLQKWIPGVVRTVAKWYLADDKRIESNLRWALKFLPEEERAALSTEEAQSTIMATIKAAYAQGPDGIIQEGQIFGRPWDFQLKDVQQHVKLFYGQKDTRTPIAFGRYYNEHLPNSELVEFENASHFNWEKYDEEVLANIINDQWQRQQQEDENGNEAQRRQ